MTDEIIPFPSGRSVSGVPQESGLRPEDRESEGFLMPIESVRKRNTETRDGRERTGSKKEIGNLTGIVVGLGYHQFSQRDNLLNENL